MKCKRLKGFTDSKPPSDLIDNCSKKKMERKLKRNQTISMGGMAKVVGCFGQKHKLSSTKIKKAPITKMTEVNVPKFEYKDHSPAFVIKEIEDEQDSKSSGSSSVNFNRASSPPRGRELEKQDSQLVKLLFATNNVQGSLNSSVSNESTPMNNDHTVDRRSTQERRDTIIDLL